jgi:predicted enzyme related to lactoylglutathione lyase
MKIKLVSIPVNDPIAAHKFYTEILDFVSIMFMPEAQLAIVASPEDPKGTGLLLEPNGNPVSKAFQEGVYKLNLPVIIFGVDDVQAEYEKLKGRGIIFRQEPTTNEWGRQAIFEDTFGNLIQIHQDPS